MGNTLVHVITVCDLLNDVIALTDLSKNTKYCPNNHKSIFEHNLSTMASLTSRLSTAVSSQQRARSVKQEYLRLILLPKNVFKKSIFERGEI